MKGNGNRMLMCCLFFLIAPPLVIADNNDTVENELTITSDSGSTETSTASESATEKASKHDDKETATISNTASNGNDDQSASDTIVKPEDREVENTTVLKVVVIQIGDEKLPIKGARVIITYGDATEFERKTDASGMAMMIGLPYGKVDVDVTSSGRQSDGGTLLLDAPNKTLTFYLKPRSVSE